MRKDSLQVTVQSAAEKAALVAYLEKLREGTCQWTGRTLIAIVLDESGSMADCVASTISGFNEYLADRKKDPGIILLMKRQFDSDYNNYRDKVTPLQPVGDVPALDMKQYRPMGGTPLYDAIGKTLHDIERLKLANDRVLFVVITDGQENTSKEFTKPKIWQMITERKNRGDWSFVFMGADQDSYANSSGIGFGKGETLNFNKAHSGDSWKGLSGSTSCYSSGAGASVREMGVMTANNIAAINPQAAVDQTSAVEEKE